MSAIPSDDRPANQPDGGADDSPDHSSDHALDDTADDRAQDRAADLLPEERTAGSDDPPAQAAAILADSDSRAAGRDGEQAGPSGAVEHRSSEETVEP